MELQQLRYFMRVAQVESVSKAAKSLHISQPALSKSIIKLEQELGNDLFDRLGKRICLNERGREFLGGVERALRELGDAVSAAGAAHDASAGSLSIGVFGPQEAAIECVRRYLELNATVSATFDARRAPAGTTSACDYDALFFSSDAAPANVHGVVCAYDRTTLLVSVDHPFAQRDSIDLGECVREPFVLLADAEEGEWASRLCAANGFSPNVRAIASNAKARDRFVDAGIGVSLVRAASVVQGSTQLRCVPVQGERIAGELLLACAPDAELSDAARSFRDFALGFFGVPNDHGTLEVFETN